MGASQGADFEHISIHALLAESDRRPGQTAKANKGFLSTLSLRRATAINGCNSDIEGISIHALLAESDQFRYVSHMGSFAFLSTLSLRRATSHQEHLLCPAADFYPRSPCGERHDLEPSTTRRLTISIHALLAESDSENVRSSP